MALESKFNFKALLPILIIIVANMMYFIPQFQGKVVPQGDIVQYTGMAKEANDYREKTGDEALWTNSMFGGMPTYQISARNKNNYLSYVEPILGFYIPRPAGYFIAGMIGFYLLMLLMGVGQWLALIGALLFGFTTNNLVLFEAGHNSKLVAIMTSAPVIAGVLMSFRGKWLLGGLIFGVAFGVNINANHPQMTYYLGLCLGILVAMEFYKGVKDKTLSKYLTSLVVLAGFGLIGIGASASKLWTTYEYQKDTMRGAPILASTGENPTSSSETVGLAYDYATQWSNGVGDLLATFIPRAVGGGSGEWIDGDSPLGKSVGQRKPFQAPTYWGELPFTSGPAYYGIIVVFLCILGSLMYKGILKWWLISAIVLTTLISMGKHFGILYQPLFDYLPLFNKFRTPSSILSVTPIFVVMLGILGLNALLKTTDKAKAIKDLYISTGVLGGLCLFLWLMGGSLFSFTSPGDAQYEQIKDVLIDQRIAMFSASAMRSFLFVMLAAGLIWMFLKDKFKSSYLLIALGLLGTFDLVQVGKRYLDGKDFVSPSTYKKNFEPRPVDLQILQDNDPNFRVYDASVNTFNSASTSYFHKTIGGYHAAKLQRYQDIIDRHISNNNQAVLNMLNTKYFIFNNESGEVISQMNPAALGNAWFINQIKLVKSANEEIDSLTNFDPAGTAFVNEEFKDYISAISPSKNGSISLKSYLPMKLTYNSDTEGEQFAVFSEIWYGPDKGWQASIDGKPVDHIRTNYLLRGLKVPSGKHEITFEFIPNSYYTGELISLICSLLLILGLFYLIYSGWKDRKDLTLSDQL